MIDQSAESITTKSMAEGIICYALSDTSF